MAVRIAAHEARNQLRRATVLSKIRSMSATDPYDLVRRGYDAVSYRYRGDDDAPAEYAEWIDGLRSRLRHGASVLDLGCGCGVPVARSLASHGYAMTGVDISEIQIERARRLVPSATFLNADATRVDFAADSFDAIVCLFVLIHLPVPAQQLLLQRMAAWLRPGGLLLVTTGAAAWTGIEKNWLGGDAPMWWSHPNAATYRRWLSDAGFIVDTEGYVPEGNGGHQLFWAMTDPA
jgi:2-polyprenyl-3-methyl-5-hydroxy-6-metoxy-1,4-benzoquinol methylase